MGHIFVQRINIIYHNYCVIKKMLFPDLEEPDVAIHISNNVQNAGIIWGFPVLREGMQLSWDVLRGEEAIYFLYRP